MKLILLVVMLLTGCAGLTEFKSTMTVSEDGKTVIMQSNIPTSGKVGDVEISQVPGDTLFEKIGKIVPNVEVIK